MCLEASSVIPHIRFLFRSSTFLWYGAIFCWVLAIIMRFEWNPLIIIELCAVAYGFFSYKITGSTNILAIILILLSSKEIECRDIICFCLR